jgi:DNA-binding transcriptional MerR regulator
VVSEAPSDRFGIAELAERAGVTPRTVRYYVAEGLLPPPGGAGQQRVYTTDHLQRLQAIRCLKEAYLPLAEIRRRLDEASAPELERLIASEPAPRSSALEYLAQIPMAEFGRQTREPDPIVGSSFAARAFPFASVRAPAPPASPGAKIPRGYAQSAEAPPADSVWHRAALAPGVELHYQLSGDRRRDEAIAHVIRAASHLLRGEPGSRSQEPGGSRPSPDS